MDNNYRPKSVEEKPTATEIDLAMQIIRVAIKKKQQCFAPQINKENINRVSNGAISAATHVMIKSGELRLKEDSYEHDWEYILR